MNYVKSCLIITMLLGVGYADCDPEADVGWNCDCNEDTWQDYYNSDGHNMQGCYLQGANLWEANLSGADLQGANLWYANLAVADLSFASLNGTGLQGALLYFANLSGADLEEADLTQANLAYANLTWANLERVNLTWANLCNLTGSPGGGVCEGVFTDNNGDGYDDVSYDAGAESGDLNLDGTDNVLDVVMLVNNILNP